MSNKFNLKKNNTPIKAYFSDLEQSEEIYSNYFSNKSAFNKEQKTNCVIEHDKFSINFLSIYGESFNVTLKNEIIKIFPITNGIIIKIKDINSDFSFFKSENLDTGNSENIQNNFYYLTNHPLSSLVLLNYPSKNYDIIKSSINYPFLIIKDNNLIKLCVIMINKIFNLKNFKENIDRLVNGKNANISINSSNNINLNDNFSSDYTFKLIDLYSFKEIHSDDIGRVSKIKFYKNASHKTYLYTAVQLDEKLFIYKIKFNNDYNLKSVDCNEYNSVIDFCLINSLLNESNELFSSFKKNKKYNINNNINTKIYDYSYDNNNTLFFIEDSYIIFSYKFNLEEKISRFKVNPPNSYHIYTKEKKIKEQMIFYCCLKEKKFYIKHIKIFEV